MSRVRINSPFLATFAFIAVAGVGFFTTGTAAPAKVSTKARQPISGSVWYEVDYRTAIAIPEFDVELRSGGKVVDQAATDDTGTFTFADVADGTYQVCWKSSGWFNGCSSSVIVNGAPARGDAIMVRPRGFPVWGRVTLADGDSAAYTDPFFGLASRPTVAIAGTTTRAPVNAEAFFVFPNVPPAAKTIVVKLGAETANAPVKPGATIRLENEAPRFKNISNSIAARGAVRVASGQSVTLDAGATDPDGDTLTYTWQAPAGQKSSQSGSTLRYKPPARPGVYSVSALAADGHGGFNHIAFDVKVALPGATASSVGLDCKTIVDFHATCGADTPAGCSNDQFLSFYKTPTAAEIATCEGAGIIDATKCGENSTAAYYAAVDPHGARQTLSAFFATAGFNPDGSGGQNVAYMNDNDLGFGRDMHFIETGGFIFSYVTNYLNNPTTPTECVVQDPANAQLAADKTASNVTATVVMEYAPLDWVGPATNPLSIAGQAPFVKFFAYDPSGNLLKAAALDPYGPKFIPNLCLNCHGGAKPGWNTASARNSANLGASFLPFDLETFRYPSSGTDFVRFKDLNVNYIPKTKPNPPIAELITGWYRSGGDVPDKAFVPAGWQGNGAAPLTDDDLAKVYYYVVARSCRTCHIAFTAKPAWNLWTDSVGRTGFQQRAGTISSFVVGSGVMPHAFVSYNNMWTKNLWPDTHTPTTFNCFRNNSANPTNLHNCLTAVPWPPP